MRPARDLLSDAERARTSSADRLQDLDALMNLEPWGSPKHNDGFSGNEKGNKIHSTAGHEALRVEPSSEPWRTCLLCATAPASQPYSTAKLRPAVPAHSLGEPAGCRHPQARPEEAPRAASGLLLCQTAGMSDSGQGRNRPKRPPEGPSAQTRRAGVIVPSSSRSPTSVRSSGSSPPRAAWPRTLNRPLSPSVLCRAGGTRVAAALRRGFRQAEARERWCEIRF